MKGWRAGTRSNVAADPYLLHQDVIDRALATICRRHGLTGVDAEDFASEVRVYLLDRDRAVLRAFKGQSSLPTFLIAVIAHRLQDWRNARWGKWRPSADARRLGPLAVRLETLTARDGLSLEEAYETLRTQGGVAVSRPEIEAIAARLPARVRRRETDAEMIDQVTAAPGRTDDDVDRAGAAEVALRASRLIDGVIRKLPPGDQLLLRLRFEQDSRVSDIARAMGLDQKALYRRFDRLLERLRSELESAGITAADAADVLAHRGFDLVKS